MAIVRWILLGTVALIAAGTWWIFVVHSEKPALGPDRYYCPMHPQIRSAAPGTCPICFMKLEPIPEERLAGAPMDAGAPAAPAVGEAPGGLSNVMLTLERREAVGIRTEPSVRKTVSQELRLPAVIEAPEKAVSEVRVRTAGFVEKVASVETGARVRSGQVLFWFYSPEILRAQEELLTARKLRGQEAEKERPEGAHSLGENVVEAARHRLILLGVHPSDIERTISEGRAERLIAVRAPADGIVTARNVSVGTQAMPEMMLFQITDLSRVWVSATLSADQLGVIATGTRGRFMSRAGERSYEVEASLVEPRVSSETRTAQVRFLAKNKDVSLLPGDIGEVIVSPEGESHVVVPRDALVDVGTVQYVFVEQSAGLFSPRVVQPGPLVGDERVILRGIESGERVVSRGAFLLDSESRLQEAVAPRQQDAAPGEAKPAAHQAHEGHEGAHK